MRDRIRIGGPLSVPGVVLAVSAAVQPTISLAQERTLEEIIVTATKRAVSLQDLSMTVTAFGEQTIREANIQNADDLAILSPALTITTNTQPNTAAFRAQPRVLHDATP